jgi:hypothetical protein
MGHPLNVMQKHEQRKQQEAYAAVRRRYFRLYRFIESYRLASAPCRQSGLILAILIILHSTHYIQIHNLQHLAYSNNDRLRHLASRLLDTQSFAQAITELTRWCSYVATLADEDLSPACDA